MTFLLAAPFAATLLLVGLARTTGRAGPRRAARFLTVGVVAVAASTTAALALLAWPLIARLGLVAHLGQWRPGAVAHGVEMPAGLSVVALAALAMIAIRIVRSGAHVSSESWRLVSVHRAAAASGAPATMVVADQMPMAYAAPAITAGGGRAVISAGLLRALDTDEQQAVVAHERAHLNHHHHLFTVLLDLAIALNPALSPVGGRARFELERWADDDAAAVTSRATVASALAKTALARLQFLRDGTEMRALRLHVERYRVSDLVAALLVDATRDEPVTRSLVVLVPAAVGVVAVVLAAHQTELAFEAIRRLR